METRPASLDGLAVNNDLDEFRVGSPREIASLLKQLLDGSVLLNLNASDGRFFTTTIWTVDSARGTLGFSADPGHPAMQALLNGDEVVVVGYLDNVKVQFDVHGLALARGAKASVLNCAFPRELYRFQRRNAFRVRPLMKASPVARLCHPDLPGSELALRILDISVGGCALFLPDEVPGMNAGARIAGVRLELDADTRLDVDLRLRYAAKVGTESRGVRLGFEFLGASGDATRTLQRFIDLTQKRAKLMALN